MPTEWKITHMNRVPEVNGFTDVIQDVEIRVYASDADGNVADRYAGVSFEAPEAGDPSFKAYGDVTEADVIGWCHAKMGADAVASLEAAAVAALDAQVNPPVISGVPWG